MSLFFFNKELHNRKREKERERLNRDICIDRDRLDRYIERNDRYRLDR